MFGFRNKRQSVTSGDFYKRISLATRESALAQIMINADKAGLLTDDMKNILHMKKDQLDEITAKKLRENTDAQNRGYWDKSPDENAKEAREWNDKFRSEEMEKFKEVLAGADFKKTLNLEQIEKKNRYRVDREKLDLINQRQRALLERR